jgi:tetratricopeptide (TPR) repeat protein
MTTSVLQDAALCLGHGEFAGALDLLGELWPGIGLRPERTGEDDLSYARLLMICGVLTLKHGVRSLRRLGDTARDILGESVGLFGVNPEGQAARLWIGVSYVDEGRFNEAIAWADTILSERDTDLEITFTATLTRAIAEMRLGQPAQGLKSLAEIEPLLPGVEYLLRGKYYTQRGVGFRSLGKLDEALNAYDLAQEQYQCANSPRFLATVLNNIANVYADQGLLTRAHVYARRAVAAFAEIKDTGYEAKALDTLAQVLLREEKYDQALQAAQRSVNLLSESDQESWLIESLITLGRAASALSKAIAIPALSRAVAISEQIASKKQSELAVEELWRIVKNSKELSRTLAGSVEDIEIEVIERILAKNNGAITSTAKELGLSHQSLTSRIKALGLTSKRQTPIKRRRSIICIK